MNTEKKLEKSVLVPEKKGLFFIFALVMTLFASVVLTAVAIMECQDQKSLRTCATKRAERYREENLALKNKYDELRYDFKELMLEAEWQQIKDEQSRKDVWACLDKPEDTLLSRDAFKAIWHIRFRACLDKIEVRDLIAPYLNSNR